MLISLLLRKYIYDMSFFRGFGLRPCSFGRTCSRRRSGSLVFKFPAAVALLWQEGQTAAAVHESLMVACQVH